MGEGGHLVALLLRREAVSLHYYGDRERFGRWSMELSPGKIKGIEALSNEHGVIAAAAMDQRGSLRKSLTAAGGREATDEDMEQFKIAVSEVLTQHASAILLDPEFGLPAARRRNPDTGLLLAYEESG